MKKLFLLALTVIFCLPIIAQETPRQSKKEKRRQRINAIAKQEEEGVIKYKKHTAFGVKLTSDGYGGFFEIGRAQSVKKGLLFQFEITERKHPKEEKQQVPFLSTSPFIYTKINYFYPVKIGVQQQFLLGNKGNKNGVSITGNIGGGLIAGLLRPYMIEVFKTEDRKFVRFDSPDSSDAADFLDPNTYYGGPNLGKGWKYLKVTPGIYLKPAVRFDYGKYNEMVSAIEIGVSGEFYSKKIPQMVYSKQRQFFFSAFVAIMFGKRK
ncbi:MAG: hypothetical protein ABIO04_04270 [Ferruginibacter sp.]